MKGDACSLTAHVEAAAKLLQNLEGQPCIETVAASQARSVMTGLREAGTLTGDQAASLTAGVKCFPCDLRDQLVSEVANRIAWTPAQSGLRTTLQNFVHIHQFFTTEERHAFSNRGAPQETKLDLLLDRAVELG